MGLKPICAHRLHHTSPILSHTCCICIVMVYTETEKVIAVDIECSGQEYGVPCEHI